MTAKKGPMTGVVIVTHGHHGAEMLREAEAIVGKLPNTRVVTVTRPLRLPWQMPWLQPARDSTAITSLRKLIGVWACSGEPRPRRSRPGWPTPRETSRTGTPPCRGRRFPVLGTWPHRGLRPCPVWRHR